MNAQQEDRENITIPAPTEDAARQRERCAAAAELWRGYLARKCLPPDTPVDLVEEDVAAMLVLLRCADLAVGEHSAAVWREMERLAGLGADFAGEVRR